MRVTLEQAAENFHADLEDMRRVVKSGRAVLDEHGTINLMLAQALSRFVSEEFTRLFGAEQSFVAWDLVYVEPTYFNLVDQFRPAEAGLLDTRKMGLAPGGRRYVQASSRDELIDAGIYGLCNQTSRVGVLIRETDCTEQQALADAYMLGDARLQQAVRAYVVEHSTLAA
ncbi:hypothetical protein HMPREF2785_04815 [Corynebacterium sp. HMSC067D03]|uniref:Uncharacterized protein n=2 Tax=Corynebacterium coyleae TaxID=53374 RepID=A0AAP6XP71_9CORY|nr:MULTISPECIES: hypothetical protein [Corynebacterium]MDK8799744.1 hypothetical protein [Corynebacterium coyleae]NJJ04463.1 hypothetical protein [Corynebacterium coyleae]OFL13717.1 hypothetical protein HMPREF2785_04815 [Corynebacterium sp. HMSC067D03]